MLLLTARGDVLLPRDVKLYPSPQKQNATLQPSRLKCPLPTVPQRSRQNPEKTGAGGRPGLSPGSAARGSLQLLH